MPRINQQCSSLDFPDHDLQLYMHINYVNAIFKKRLFFNWRPFWIQDGHQMTRINQQCSNLNSADHFLQFDMHIDYVPAIFK